MALYDIPLKTIDGAPADLGQYRGKPILVVNVASKCGLTPQYEGLERIYETYRDRGLVVAGFPANNFGGQEPGTEAEIADFCATTYDVKFPLFSKIEVTGPDQHPLYRELIAEKPEAQFKPESTMRQRFAERGRVVEPGQVLWNFEKFLVGRDGKVAARFAPDTTPEDPVVIAAIEAELAKG